MEGDVPDHRHLMYWCSHFNPLPPHGGRLLSAVFMTILSVFQSTPSAWRETFFLAFMLSPLVSFQSTPSAWRETAYSRPYRFLIAISIHSLRMEGDVDSATGSTNKDDFNPLPPHGGRRHAQHIPIRGYNFNPLPPHGGRPLYQVPVFTEPSISIHSLRMEGDRWNEKQSHDAVLFQSTPSAWRETLQRPALQCCGKHFNPLPPHGGRPCFFLT